MLVRLCDFATELVELVPEFDERVTKGYTITATVRPQVLVLSTWTGLVR